MSEFEYGTDECINIVRNHRECFPSGERVVLASEEKCRKLIEDNHLAHKAKVDAVIQRDMARAETRTWQVLTIASGVIGIVAGFVTGILV